MRTRAARATLAGVHYALEEGVPLLVAGRTEDKIEVSARTAWSGAGIDLRTNSPAPDRIAKAVMAVLSSDAYRKSAARIGAEIVASPGPAGILTLLESWAAEEAGPPSVPEPAAE